MCIGGLFYSRILLRIVESARLVEPHIDVSSPVCLDGGMRRLTLLLSALLLTAAPALADEPPAAADETEPVRLAGDVEVDSTPFAINAPLPPGWIASTDPEHIGVFAMMGIQAMLVKDDDANKSGATIMVMRLKADGRSAYDQAKSACLSPAGTPLPNSSLVRIDDQRAYCQDSDALVTMRSTVVHLCGGETQLAFMAFWPTGDAVAAREALKIVESVRPATLKK